MNKNKLAYSEGIFSIIINIILFVIKFWAGTVSGSIALISDAWHSLSDSLSSIALIFGTKIASKPADENHPFGHGRAEFVTAIIIGVMLNVVALSFFKESISALTTGKKAIFGTNAIIVIIISILAKEVSAQYAFYTARKTGFLSLKADAWHHRSDAISSILILIGIFINPFFSKIDGILGIIVSLFIFNTAYKIIKKSASAILGEAAKPKLLSKIINKANESAGYDVYAHNINLHKYGNYTEATFHIRLDSKLTIYEGNLIAYKIHKDIKNDLQIFSTIHIDAIISKNSG